MVNTTMKHTGGQSSSRNKLKDSAVSGVFRDKISPSLTWFASNYRRNNFEYSVAENGQNRQRIINRTNVCAITMAIVTYQLAVCRFLELRAIRRCICQLQRSWSSLGMHQAATSTRHTHRRSTERSLHHQQQQHALLAVVVTVAESRAAQSIHAVVSPFPPPPPTLDNALSSWNY